MSTLHDRRIHTNVTETVLEYDEIASGHEISVWGYGNTIIIHGDIGMGGKLCLSGGNLTVTVEGSMSFYSQIRCTSGGTKVSVLGDLAANAQLILDNYATVYIEGGTSRDADIYTGYDSLVNTRPILKELTPEEYGTYSIDLFNQDLLGVDYSPHMGMSFRDWIVRRTPRSMPHS